MNTNTTIIKPFLAKDVNLDKLKFPPEGLMLLPKYDGSFGFVQNSKLYARSLKQHENLYVTQKFSKEKYEGLRGELIYGFDPTAQDLCRKTSSALRTIQGEPNVSLQCFDYVTHETKNLPYATRYAILQDKVHNIYDKYVDIIPCYNVYSIEDIDSLSKVLLNAGYEGYVLRDPNAVHKEGRSSAVKPELWRWKPWSTAEIVVTELIEEKQNNNVATTNELGYTSRSSHKDNLSAKGTLGAIAGTLVNDLLDYSGKVVAKAGTKITIATGVLTAKECKYYWDNPEELLKFIVEFDYMSYGLKDNARFAQFKRIRSERDM